MEMALIAGLAYLAGVTSTSLAVVLWSRRRPAHEHRCVIVAPQRPFGPGPLPPYWATPRHLPPDFPGPAAPPPYW
ncbi:hypothetical protein M8542_42015 [Amycolatopsis sp. OK19-0408]|uniref:Uncharacterized protein n=1 Tax=Amycolatopsis iheyensis TaxID=2945988 RepID=A0A9X2SP11_9PSEU|nr:hypothetical protein [Amycolatopsis iheyensis]MCR6489414.1 hypothetical protein [Amycolatopsis iheyensis]